jgi:hypothetical protein
MTFKLLLEKRRLLVVLERMNASNSRSKQQPQQKQHTQKQTHQQQQQTHPQTEVWKPPKVAATAADAHLPAENRQTAEHPGEETKHVNIVKNKCIIVVMLVL